MEPLALWAGPECTVNRVGDVWRDQLEETGFARRLDDLDRLAGLGIRCLRFPLLWERGVQAVGEPCDWRWADVRIERLRALGVDCIAGLVHHGSGPRGTQLLDPAFPQALAGYARAVAERYPHLSAYTPVNEPQTTARFSALYGIWYPHQRDDRAFLRALLHQVQATRLAMREIRAVNPAARLVQTDDLGHVDSTPTLRYQAEFENIRRWLGFDLLCGRVDRHHPLWAYLLRNGIAAGELRSLVDDPCPPDVVGINHYLTSDRFLDDRIGHYPASMHGGNGRHRYVDVESVRVLGALPGGMEARLREAWQRYRLPVAITEVHLGCTREEQLRWLVAAWNAAQRLRDEGATVRAVTIWAAFGTTDWDSLLCQTRGAYEPGMWDARSEPPRPTALARVASQLAHRVAPEHPVLG
ncbi:MAG: dTDP-4-dehydrorhamnose reductase, partial [Pseudomonadota bacterium]|nr:dTDP-4-dehydrorhamnose reductase [Pseudomonadota bacterium]